SSSFWDWRASPAIYSTGRESLWLVVVLSLHGKASMIDCLALAALDHKLADPHAWPQQQRFGAQVGHLQHLAVVDARLEEAGRHVHSQAQAGEAAAPFQPAAQRWRQRDPLHRQAQHRLARL